MGTKGHLLLLLVYACLLAGCGGSSGTSTSGNGNSSGTPSGSNESAAISIAFQSPPATTLTINATEQLTAVVKNDSNDYGVDWCIAISGAPCGAPNCNPATCGTLSTAHTDSGKPVTYAPPATLNGNQTTVNIVAFATADHSKNVFTTIKVSGFSGNLQGTYVFQAKGSDADPTTFAVLPYQVAGVVNLDGNGGLALVSVNGKMIAGEQAYSDSERYGAATITGGSYSLSADGRGVLTLNTSDNTIGLKGTETFSIVFLSNSQVLIAQVDGSASASGTMDLQTSTAAPAGGYAFTLSGVSVAGTPTAFGGVFNIDQPNGGISGQQSVVDLAQNGSLLNCPAPVLPGDLPGLTGTVSAPDSFGMVQLSLMGCFSPQPIQVTGFVVDNTHIKLVESDLSRNLGTGYATSGVALGQGSMAGKFTGAQAFSGNYLFGLSGQDSSGSPSSLTAAGLASSNGNGQVTGTSDEFSFFGLAVSDTYSGAYTVDAAGTGRVDAPVSFTNPANSAASTPELVFYLTGNATPMAVLIIDPVGQTVGAGTVYPQAPAPFVLSGPYGFSALNLSFSSPFGIANDDVSGQMAADPTAKTLTGFMDGTGFLNENAIPLTGAFDTIPNNGRFGGSLSAPGTGILGFPAAIEFYMADSGHGFFIETDLASPLLLGTFAVRTPVCPTCP